MINAARILVLVLGAGLFLILAINGALASDLALVLKAVVAAAVTFTLYRQLSPRLTAQEPTESEKSGRKRLSKQMIWGLVLGFTVPVAAVKLLIWWIDKQ
jgi:hypothetical protein